MELAGVCEGDAIVGEGDDDMMMGRKNKNNHLSIEDVSDSV